MFPGSEPKPIAMCYLVKARLNDSIQRGAANLYRRYAVSIPTFEHG